MITKILERITKAIQDEDHPVVMVLVHPVNLCGHTLEDQNVTCFRNVYATKYTFNNTEANEDLRDEDLLNSPWEIGTTKNCYNCGGFFSGLSNFDKIEEVDKGVVPDTLKKYLACKYNNCKGKVEIEMFSVQYFNETREELVLGTESYYYPTFSKK